MIFDGLKVVLGVVLYGGFQLPAAFLLSGLISRRVDQKQLETADAIFFGLFVLLMWWLITWSLRPRIFEFRRKAEAPSTSRAHYLSDVFWILFGASLIHTQLTHDGTFEDAAWWGLAHILVAVTLGSVRLFVRPETPDVAGA